MQLIGGFDFCVDIIVTKTTFESKYTSTLQTCLGHQSRQGIAWSLNLFFIRMEYHQRLIYDLRKSASLLYFVLACNSCVRKLWYCLIMRHFVVSMTLKQTLLHCYRNYHVPSSTWPCLATFPTL